MSIEGFAGCKLWAPRVILVSTQADMVDGGVKGDPDGLVNELQHRYETDVIIEPHLFVVDSLSTSRGNNSEMTMLKRAIDVIKQFICEVGCCPWPWILVVFRDKIVVLGPGLGLEVQVMASDQLTMPSLTPL